MGKILLVGSQHGNEPLGFHLYAHLKLHHPDVFERVEFYVANPLAVDLGRRYVESDMNRSYGSNKESTYESRQALKLVSLIRLMKPDLILDLHTTTCVQPPSILITNQSDYTRRFIASSSISKVMVMSDEIARHSLIGINPRAVAIEVSNSDLDINTYESLSGDIRCYIKNQKQDVKRHTYDITAKIEKNSLSRESISLLRNFELSREGFIPYLVGPNNSYSSQTNYIGFKAKLRGGDEL